MPPATAAAALLPPGHGRPPSPKLPPLAPLDRRLRVALKRGTQTVDAKLDLHGLRQAEAHGALVAFLVRARARGARVVLVVTGKGGAPHHGDPFGERGVLRRLVPQWLCLPDLRSVVLGFEEAGREHGGEGALYVRLRRRRAGGERP
ncbi:Smr/MutS family protein [Chelatococcus albus]